MDEDWQEAESLRYSRAAFFVLPLKSGKIAVLTPRRDIFAICDTWEDARVIGFNAEPVSFHHRKKTLNEEYHLPEDGEPMQTFLPYPDFYQSLQCLDNQRLGKQRVEAVQILSTLLNGGGWQHHPAAKMWKGYESALALYYTLSVRVWLERGFKNTMVPPYDVNTYEINETWIGKILPVDQIVYPGWLGNEEFHASHRSNLLRKDPFYYGENDWEESADLPYYWPTRNEEEVLNVDDDSNPEQKPAKSGEVNASVDTKEEVQPDLFVRS